MWPTRSAPGGRRSVSTAGVTQDNVRWSGRSRDATASVLLLPNASAEHEQVHQAGVVHHIVRDLVVLPGITQAEEPLAADPETGAHARIEGRQPFLRSED